MLWFLVITEGRKYNDVCAVKTFVYVRQSLTPHKYYPEFREDIENEEIKDSRIFWRLFTGIQCVA